VSKRHIRFITASYIDLQSSKELGKIINTGTRLTICILESVPHNMTTFIYTSSLMHRPMCLCKSACVWA